MDPFKYRIIVEWSEEDEAYIARVPAFPGCAVHGATSEEAAHEARVAANGMLEVMREHGDPIPAEDSTADFSGNIRLRLPRSLHERLARLAFAEGVSLNQLMVTVLAQSAGEKRSSTA
jgi:predicted RNase H-like HicB family nuclease